MNLRSLLTITGAALCAAPLSSQQLSAGYADQITTLAPTAGNVHVLPGGGIVSFDGTKLVIDETGQPTRTLLQLSAFAFGSFTVDAGPGRLLFGESSTNNVWLVPLAGPAPTTPLANVVFNYDAALLDAQRAIVSAKRTGFGDPNNDLVVIDLTTGSVQLLASLPGASGPVTVAANGDVYYATGSLAFPVPAGQAAIVRLRRPSVDLALQQQSVLTIADAEIVIAGLDVASDMCFDDDGDLLFVDWFNNEVGEVNDATGTSAWLGEPLIEYGASTGAATVQFHRATGHAVFEPFQPAAGRLIVHETDFFSTSSLRTVKSRRPAVASSPASPIPAGTFTLQVADGPANGIGIVLLSPWVLPGSIALPLPGNEAPLHLSPAVLLGALPLLASFDAQCAASVSFWNPGFRPGLWLTTQSVFIDETLSVGSSSSRVLKLAR
jgi:hypothetical protein